jgi:F-type H+-transporting ATPase subunit b
MLIDGFTVVAQIVNFLVLVVLLHRFLYRPIVRAMSEREARIAAEVSEAEALKQQAMAEAEMHCQQRLALEQQREALMSEARDEVESWRRVAVVKARQEIAEARVNWQKSIMADQAALTQEVRRRIGQQVCTISRKALSELANATLEQQMITVFMQRLEALEAHERALLIESAQRIGSVVAVRSAFEVPDTTRRHVVQGIHKIIGRNLGVEFETVPELLCGIEIGSADYRLAWTLEEYLASLEDHLIDVFDEETERERAGSSQTVL